MSLIITSFPVSFTYLIEWMSDNPGVQVKFYQWWKGERFLEAVKKVDPIGSHASWFENFPPFEDMQLNQVEVDGAGDIAYVYGTFSMILMLPDVEEPVPDAGKYIEIWRRQADGSWKIVMDIFNSDLPVPEG